jgi:glyoxylase-like metal-dependent hydrolase (beta-lactamase superfamily II)
VQEREDWTAPGAYRVAPGVHRIPLPLPMDGLRAVNVYAVEDGDELVLVDAGWAIEDSLTALRQGLARIDRDLADVTRILVTHAHRDHYTQAVVIRRAFGAHVSLGVGDRPAIDLIQRGTSSLGRRFAQLRSCGAEPVALALRAVVQDTDVDPADWEAPDAWLEDDQNLGVDDRSLRALATPGHTAGHTVFADLEAGLLFSGDHVLPHITPSIGYEAVATPLPLRDYLHSLARVRQLPDLRMLPAHGPVGPSVHARVDKLLWHHDQRLAACLEAVEAGATTAYETALLLRWTSRGRHFDALDAFNQMLATLETRAHLELLVARGVLASVTDDGISRYHATAGDAHALRPL